MVTIIGHLTQQAVADKVMALKEEAANDLDESRAHSGPGSQDTQGSFWPTSPFGPPLSHLSSAVHLSQVKASVQSPGSSGLKSQLLPLTSCVT